jgi:hypothetical protein
LDFLRSTLGNLTASIIRLGVIAGTLALIYLFAIRPVLDTTEKAFEPFNRSLELSQRQLREGLRQAQQQNTTQVTVPEEAQLSLDRAQRLLACIQRANHEVNRIAACQRRFPVYGQSP